jgi:hypothetical protein
VKGFARLTSAELTDFLAAAFAGAFLARVVGFFVGIIIRNKKRYKS